MDRKAYGRGGNLRSRMGGNFGKDGGFVLMASIWKEDLDFVNDDIETIGYNEIIRI